MDHRGPASLMTTRFLRKMSGDVVYKARESGCEGGLGGQENHVVSDLTNITSGVTDACSALHPGGVCTAALPAYCNGSLSFLDHFGPDLLPEVNLHNIFNSVKTDLLQMA